MSLIRSAVCDVVSVCVMRSRSCHPLEYSMSPPIPPKLKDQDKRDFD